MSKKQMHININVQAAGSHGAAWRSNDGRRFGYLEIEYFQEIARIAERGCADAIFLADYLNIFYDPAISPSWALDNAVTVAAMAAVTTKLGFIASASTTYNHPYHLARTFASLDHLSHGRIGWNIVTTYDERAAGNFGDRSLPQHEDRYGRASEAVDVMQALWDSWEDEALVGDRKTGRFADTSKIHRIDYKGNWFDVAGPLQVPRSPQGHPVLVQAGSSEQGRDFAARHAEAVFTAQQTLSEAKRYYADVKERARRFGRDPDKLSILPGLTVVVAATEAEAMRRRKELDEIAGENMLLERFAGRFSLDPKELELDKPIAPHLVDQIERSSAARGFIEATLALTKDSSLTVRRIVALGGGTHRTVIGAPEQVADSMEEWVNGGGADGFNIQCDVFPTGLTAFVDHVVPELQKRGSFRREYSGTTLRDHYGLDRPKGRFAR